MKESDIERADRHQVEEEGGLLLKFISPGRNHVPDRLLLRRIPAAHRDIVARYFRLVEYKRPGEKPRPGQLREHERLREMGYQVDVIDGPGQLK